MNALDPLITHSSPSRLAVVRVAPASEPPPGSVRPNAPSFSPAAKAGQPPLLLRLGAEPVNRHGAERDPGLQRDGHGGVDPGQFLQGQAQGEVVPAHAAVLLGDRQAEQAHRAHLGHDLVGELGALVELADDRGDLLAGKVLDGGAQRLVLLGQREVHNSCSCSSTGSTTSSTASLATAAPGLARRSRTMPSTGAARTCSIFIASTTTRRWPAVTAWPSATSTRVTVPGMGETTGPPAPAAACTAAASSGACSRTAQAWPSRPSHSVSPSSATA